MRRRKRELLGYAAAAFEQAAAAQAEGRLRPGEVYTLEVRHDDECRMLAGYGVCDCSPEIGVPKRVPAVGEN
jgi:hypothetical protein